MLSIFLIIVWNLEFGIWNLLRISDFGFRISLNLFRAKGWTLIFSAKINSILASPTPSTGKNEYLNADSGEPILSIIFVFSRGIFLKSYLLVSKGILPLKILPLPLVQSTVTSCPVFNIFVALPVPTIAGIPNSREIMAA